MLSTGIRQRANVGTVVNAMGRNTMHIAMARQE